MCLYEVYTDEDMNAIVKGLPEVAPGVVVGHKIVDVRKDGYYSWDWPSWNYKFAPRMAAATKTKIRAPQADYWSGFHFFLKINSKIAKNVDKPDIFRRGESISSAHITCLVPKDSITAVGRENNIDRSKCIIASQAFFPTYPETEARLEDFLAWLKDNDPEYAESQLCEAVK